jgi:tetratricopeptide (TPR) repeat protein
MDKSSTLGETRPTPRGRRRIMFVLAAILLGTSPFIVLEITLRALGIGKPTSLVDPNFGFGPLHPLFELDQKKTSNHYHTSRSRSLYFGDQQFPASKGEETFRIFCLGGSTVRGRPYTTDTAFSQWMQIELNARDPSRNYEVINCGGLSYASYRVNLMLDEILTYQPDLLVIATGQNEFLEDRTYSDVKESSAGILAWLGSLRMVTVARSLFSDADVDQARRNSDKTLPGEVAVLLDEDSGYGSYHRDLKWQADVKEHFQHSLRSMITRCREKEVPLALVAMGSNLRDCPPFKSEYAAGTSVSEQQEWERFFQQATKLPGDPESALILYLLAAEIDDQHALLHYHMARCHDLLGEYAEAKAAYRKAKQLDICPLRILDEMQVFVRQLASETDTPLADVAKSLSAESPQGIAGNDVYMDHVHPTIGAHQLIARTIIEELVASQIVNISADWPARERRAAYREQMASLPRAHLGNGRRRVGWLEGWAQRDRMLKVLEPVDARGYVHSGQRKLHFAEHDEAWQDFAIAMLMEEEAMDLILHFAAQLVAEGRPADSRHLLDQLAAVPAGEGQLAEIRLGQLVTMRELGQHEEADRQMEIYGDQIREVPAENHWQSLLGKGVNE